jgi:uncharacterized protein (TIGR02271 family)
MQHTIAAVFDQQSQAQQAIDDLVASGFSRDTVSLTQSNATAKEVVKSEDEKLGSNDLSATGEDTTMMGSIKHFFSGLFGNDPVGARDADLYSTAVMNGHFVLTVRVPDDNLVDRATEVLDRHSPLDIDEQANKWKSGGWSAADSMRQSPIAGQQASAPASMQDAGSMTGLQNTGSTAGLRDTGSTSSLQDAGIGGAIGGGAGSGSAMGATPGAIPGAEATRAIPVIEEELRVGKREVQRGGVRVYSRTVETPVQESVNLREETVSVERRPVNQPVSAADLAALKDTTIEMRETVEEPVVEKVARVVEEVVVGKEVSQHQQQVTDTVRHTEVNVEQLTPGTTAASAAGSRVAGDDAYYRSHWNSNFASAGGSYDDYAPAYQYGESLAGNEQNKGRRWDELEPGARSNWESKHSGSAWEKMKDAVRHGWDRMST